MNKTFEGFVRFSLSESDKEAIRTCSSDPADIVEMIASLIDDGYKVELRKDYYGDGIQCTLYGTAASKNDRRALTGRGRNAYTAVRQAWWVDRYLFAGQWPDPTKPMRLSYDD